MPNEVVKLWSTIQYRGCFYRNVHFMETDFYVSSNLYWLCFQFPGLSNFDFPGKRAFNNTNKEFLDRRAKSLGEYLQVFFRNSFISKRNNVQGFVFNAVPDMYRSNYSTALYLFQHVLGSRLYLEHSELQRIMFNFLQPGDWERPTDLTSKRVCG